MCATGVIWTSKRQLCHPSRAGFHRAAGPKYKLKKDLARPAGGREWGISPVEDGSAAVRREQYGFYL